MKRGQVTKSNLPNEACLWSIQKASMEFHIDSTTLAKRIAANKDVPIQDTGCYTTLQIIAAVFTDSRRLKDELTMEETRGRRLDNEAKEGNLLDKNVLIQMWDRYLAAVVQVVKSSELPEDKKNELLENMRGCLEVINGVSDRQRENGG